MYEIKNSGKLSADELTYWLINEAGLKQSQCKMAIYFKYAPYRKNIVVSSYADDCVYWYTSEAIGKWFVYTLGNILPVEFLLFENWFMSIRILQLKDHYISVDQDIYATSVVSKYIDTAIFKTSTKFYQTISPYAIIFTKDDVSTSDEEVGNLNG